MDALMSPLLRSSQGIRPPPASAATEAEVEAITALARTRGATRLAIGSGRADGDLATVRAVATRWEMLGGETLPCQLVAEGEQNGLLSSLSIGRRRVCAGSVSG